MENIVLDFRGLGDREELHDIIEQAMELPDYYGRNLDALYDVLTETRNDRCFTIYYDSEKSVYLKKLLEVFYCAQEENEGLRVFFADTEEEE